MTRSAGSRRGSAGSAPGAGARWVRRGRASPCTAGPGWRGALGTGDPRAFPGGGRMPRAPAGSSSRPRAFPLVPRGGKRNYAHNSVQPLPNRIECRSKYPGYREGAGLGTGGRKEQGRFEYQTASETRALRDGRCGATGGAGEGSSGPFFVGSSFPLLNVLHPVLAVPPLGLESGTARVSFSESPLGMLGGGLAGWQRRCCPYIVGPLEGGQGGAGLRIRARDSSAGPSGLLALCSQRPPAHAGLGNNTCVFQMPFPRFMSPGAELLPWAGAPSGSLSYSRGTGTPWEGTDQWTRGGFSVSSKGGHPWFHCVPGCGET